MCPGVQAVPRDLGAPAERRGEGDFRGPGARQDDPDGVLEVSGLNLHLAIYPRGIRKLNGEEEGKNKQM